MTILIYLSATLIPQLGLQVVVSCTSSPWHLFIVGVWAIITFPIYVFRCNIFCIMKWFIIKITFVYGWVYATKIVGVHNHEWRGGLAKAAEVEAAVAAATVAVVATAAVAATVATMKAELVAEGAARSGGSCVIQYNGWSWCREWCYLLTWNKYEDNVDNKSPPSQIKNKKELSICGDVITQVIFL